MELVRSVRWKIVATILALVAVYFSFRSLVNPNAISFVTRAPSNTIGLGSSTKQPVAIAEGRVESNAVSSVAERDPVVEATNDLFRVVSFVPVPAPMSAQMPVAQVPPPAPPPKPVAPPFPFTYFGKMTGIDGKDGSYLNRGDQFVLIRAGDVLDGVYRIDDINPSAVVFTYLPLEEKLELSVRSASDP